jgi:hypothetical protein
MDTIGNTFSIFINDRDGQRMGYWVQSPNSIQINKPCLICFIAKALISLWGG